MALFPKTNKIVTFLNERFWATKWPEMLFDACLVTFVFSPSEVKSLVSGDAAGNLGLVLVLSPAEMLMFGNEAWQYCLIKFSLEDVEQGFGIQVRRASLTVACHSIKGASLIWDGVSAAPFYLMLPPHQVAPQPQCSWGRFQKPEVLLRRGIGFGSPVLPDMHEVRWNRWEAGEQEWEMLGSRELQVGLCEGPFLGNDLGWFSYHLLNEIFLAESHWSECSVLQFAPCAKLSLSPATHLCCNTNSRQHRGTL